MSIKTSISDRSPQIFLAMGIAGFIGSTVLAVAKADKVKPIFEKAKKEFKQPPTPGSKSNTKIIMEASIDVFKEMALPIGLTIMSTGFLLKSYNVLNNRHLAAVGTIDILNTSLNAHKKAVKEELGEEAVKQKHISTNCFIVGSALSGLGLLDSTKHSTISGYPKYLKEKLLDGYRIMARGLWILVFLVLIMLIMMAYSIGITA